MISGTNDLTNTSCIFNAILDVIIEWKGLPGSYTGRRFYFMNCRKCINFPFFIIR